MAQEHTMTVARTARYYTLGGTTVGGLSAKTQHIWFVLHGFGQLARYFIRRFDVVANEETLIVAPEGLSRSYLTGEYTKIGASWITREARDEEIADYVAYLNQLYDALIAAHAGPLHVTVLGFSQGAATACRWLNNGHVTANRLILWAGFFANGLGDLIDPTRLANVPVEYVYGEQDEYLTKLPDPDTYLHRLQTELPVLKLVSFNGGHTVERDVLKELVTDKR